MAGNSVLMLARTVAEWGGLHEYVEGAARCLVGAGNAVTVACGSGLVADRLRATGATVVEADWNDWQADADRLRQNGQFDLVFAHAAGTRDLALYVSQEWETALYVMFHGAFHDFVYTWSDRVTGFLAVSPSMVDFLVRIGKVPPWKIDMVPNGVPDHVFGMPSRSLAEKLEGRVGRIVMASRIAHDKVEQFPIAKEVLLACAEIHPEVTWRLEVLGDGPLRPRFERDMQRFADRHPHVEVAFRGWVSPEEVPLRMNAAVIGIVAGRGGLTALASGALCVGVGARGSVGVQVGSNLRAGLFSNFGDHPAPRFSPSPIGDDLKTWLQPGPYESALVTGRLVVQRSRSASVVNGALLSALQCG